MLQFAALVLHQVKLFLKHPDALVLILLLPFILTSLLSIAFEDIVEGKPRVEVRLIDQDRTETSRLVIEGLRASEVIDLDVRAGDADPESLIDARRFAALVIPAGFEESLLGEGRAALELYGDPARQSYVEILEGQVQGTLAIGQVPDVVAGAVAEEDREAARAAAAGAIAAAVERGALDVQSATEEGTLSSVYEQTVPGFAILFGFFITVYLAVNLYNERDVDRTWARTLVAPVPRIAVLGALVVSFALLGAAQLGILLGLGRLVWGMSLGDAPGALILTVALWSAVGAAFGLMVSALMARALSGAAQLLNLCAILLGALGGALIPVAFLPGWLAAVAPFVPQYWAVDALQDVIARGKGLGDVLPQLGVLLAFGALFLAVALRARRLERV